MPPEYVACYVNDTAKKFFVGTDNFNKTATALLTKMGGVPDFVNRPPPPTFCPCVVCFVWVSGVRLNLELWLRKASTPACPNLSSGWAKSRPCCVIQSQDVCPDGQYLFGGWGCF